MQISIPNLSMFRQNGEHKPAAPPPDGAESEGQSRQRGGADDTERRAGTRGVRQRQDSAQQQLQPLRQVHPGQLQAERHGPRVSSWEINIELYQGLETSLLDELKEIPILWLKKVFCRAVR